MKKFYGLLLSLCVSMPASASLISLDFKWISLQSPATEFPWYVPSPSSMNIVIDDTVANSADPIADPMVALKFENLIKGGSVNVGGRDFFFDVNSPNEMRFYEEGTKYPWDRIDFKASTSDSTGVKKDFWLGIELLDMPVANPTDLQFLYSAGPQESFGAIGKTNFNTLKFTISEVPEPGSLVLALLGLIGVVAARLFKTRR